LVFALYSVGVGISGIRATHFPVVINFPELALERARLFFRLSLGLWVVDALSGVLTLLGEGSDDDRGSNLFNLFLRCAIQTYLLYICWSYLKRLPLSVLQDPAAPGSAGPGPHGITMTGPGGILVHTVGGGWVPHTVPGRPVSGEGLGYATGVPVAAAVGRVEPGYPVHVDTTIRVATVREPGAALGVPAS